MKYFRQIYSPVYRHLVVLHIKNLSNKDVDSDRCIRIPSLPSTSFLLVGKEVLAHATDNWPYVARCEEKDSSYIAPTIGLPIKQCTSLSTSRLRPEEDGSSKPIRAQNSLCHGKSPSETCVKTCKENSQNPLVSTNLQEIQTNIMMENLQSPKLHKRHQAGHRMYKLKGKCTSEYERCTNLPPSQKSRCVLLRTKSISTCDSSIDSTSDKTLIDEMTRLVTLKLSYAKMSFSPN